MWTFLVLFLVSSISAAVGGEVPQEACRPYERLYVEKNGGSCQVCDCDPHLGWACTVIRTSCNTQKASLLPQSSLRQQQNVKAQPCVVGSTYHKLLGMPMRQGLRNQQCQLCTCQEYYGWVCNNERVPCPTGNDMTIMEKDLNIKSKVCYGADIKNNMNLIECFECSCDSNGLLLCKPVSENSYTHKRCLKKSQSNERIVGKEPLDYESDESPDLGNAGYPGYARYPGNYFPGYYPNNNQPLNVVQNTHVKATSCQNLRAQKTFNDSTIIRPCYECYCDYGDLLHCKPDVKSLRSHVECQKDQMREGYDDTGLGYAGYAPINGYPYGYPAYNTPFNNQPMNIVQNTHHDGGEKKKFCFLCVFAG